MLKMKLSLHLRLSLIIAVFSLVIAAIVSMGFYFSAYKREEGHSLQAVQELSQTVYNSASIAAYASNKTIASDVLKGLMKNELVNTVSIETPDFTLVVGHPDATPLTQIKRDIFSPFDSAEKLGTLTITPSREVIDQRATRVAVELATQVILIIFISATSITFFTWLLIGRPITQLAQNLNKINPAVNQNRLIPPKFTKNSELELFSNTVNNLLDRVEVQIEEERNLRDKVELIAQNFQMIFEKSSTALLVTDPELNLKNYNPAFQEIIFSATGHRYPAYDTSWIRLFSDDTSSLIHQLQQLVQTRATSSIDVKLDTTQQQTRWFSLSVKEATNHFNERNIMMFINDITRQRQAIDASEYAASHDHLTHLKNRRIAEQQIESMITDAIRENYSIAVLVIDLDGFKLVNDQLGHDAGDKVLQVVAKRLRKLTRKTDIVARWGGDEFTIALSRVTKDQAYQLTAKIQQAIARPIVIDPVTNQMADIGSSIGLVMCPEYADDFPSAFELADSAMYRVKQSGKRAIIVYEND